MEQKLDEETVDSSMGGPRREQLQPETTIASVVVAFRRSPKFKRRGCATLGKGLLQIYPRIGEGSVLSHPIAGFNKPSPPLKFHYDTLETFPSGKVKTFPR